MKFKAITSTSDGRLTKGKIYRGQLIVVPKKYADSTGSGGPVRVIVFDDKGSWITFNPKAFIPWE